MLLVIRAESTQITQSRRDVRIVETTNGCETKTPKGWHNITTWLIMSSLRDFWTSLGIHFL